MQITVNALWDDDTNVWVATSDDVPGLVAEAPTVEILRQKVLNLIPELFELNGQSQPHGTDIPLRIRYEVDWTLHIA